MSDIPDVVRTRRLAPWHPRRSLPVRPASRSRSRRALVALAAVLLLVLFFFPWNTLRDPIADYLSEKTGRKVVIAGDLTVKLAWHPWIDVRGVAIANAPWSDEPVMASVQRIGMRVVPLSYFTRLRIPEIELDAPRVILERNAQGQGNWVMGDSAASNDTTDAGDLPLIGRVNVTDGNLRYRDPDPRMRLDVRAHLLTAQDRQGRESLVFSGDGTMRGGRFSIAGQGEGLGTLREVDAPFSLVFNAKTGATQILVRRRGRAQRAGERARLHQAVGPGHGAALSAAAGAGSVDAAVPD